MNFRFFLFFLITLVTFASYTQDLSGVWRGAMIQNGLQIEKGLPFWMDISISGNTITGFSRDELYATETFAVKKLEGKQNGNTLSFKQMVITKKTTPNKTSWCRVESDLTYNPKTGYLEGTYKSTDCRNSAGKFILYRVKSTMSQDEQMSESHHWFDLFVKDLAKGLNAPEIRDFERKNFVFEPIYFDYDKAEIRPEFDAFLLRMMKIVEGHSDLRVLVTGHTDADGSDQYNDGLSKRRAEAIINYFTAHGLSKDRLEFDFKGEKQPIDNNETPEGKQKNRRVDFKFI